MEKAIKFLLIANVAVYSMLAGFFFYNAVTYRECVVEHLPQYLAYPGKLTQITTTTCTGGTLTNFFYHPIKQIKESLTGANNGHS